MVGNTKLYYQELDGLRGYACLAIMLFHVSEFGILKTFWIGVPVFFVISGFLITQILLLNKSSDNYFKTFYFRRAIRIFPIYYIVLFCCVIFAIIGGFNLSQGYYYLLYLQSFLISASDNLFCNSILQHTWSLSIEEIFYLFWPLIIYYSKKNIIIYLCIILLILSMVYKINMFFLNKNEDLLFLSIFGNIDALMIGSILGYLSLYKSNFVYAVKHNKWFFYFSSGLLFLLILTAGLFLKTTLIKILLYEISILFSAVLIVYLCSDNPKPKVTFAFNNKIIISIGKISYGLYLYHYVIFRFFDSACFHYNIQINEISSIILKFIITFLIAIISWNFIEKPLLTFKTKYSYA